jgi:hypothetical protein
MSTVYQLAEEVKQYESKLRRSKLRRENTVQKRMKIKAQKEERIAQYIS